MDSDEALEAAEDQAEASRRPDPDEAYERARDARMEDLMTYDPRRENPFDQCKTLVQLNAVTPSHARRPDDIVPGVVRGVGRSAQFRSNKFAWAAEDEASGELRKRRRHVRRLS